MPPHPKWMNKNELRKILKLWEKDNVLRFGEVHRGLVKLGLVKPNDRKKTVRILRKLIQEGYVEEVSEGYRLALKLKEFNVMEYISKLLKHYGKKNLIYEGRVGGHLWTLAELTLIGFPELDRERLKKLEEEYPALHLTMEVLMVRLARIYEALRKLAYIFRARLEGRKVDNPMKIEAIREDILRETLLELIPYYLGERAGIDGDGLNTEDLIKAYKIMIRALPGEVEYQQPTCKDLLMDSFNSLKEYAEILGKLMGKMVERWDHGEDVEDLDGSYDFVLIVGPPREVVDWKEENFRRLFSEIRLAKKCGIESAIFYVHLIRGRYLKPEEAKTALKRLRLFGLIDRNKESKIKEILEFYREGRKLKWVTEEYWRIEKFKKLLDEGYAPGRYGVVEGTVGRKMLPLEEAEKMFREIAKKEGVASIRYLTLPNRNELEKRRSELIEVLNAINMNRATVGIWLFKVWPISESAKKRTVSKIVKAVKGLGIANTLEEKLKEGYKVATKLLKERSECNLKFTKCIVEKLGGG